ncbi:alpha/beta fold hydrolase [Ideonella dechloratans]|uniref:Alpha/beta fold hydrolase n=1 Tax=Ideonella dechloratans TaxID=36863 RepID=A0A643FB48_IDEDE|nr:alpha/beta fold hydrolase [Ideonella dechloratans]KAB0581212.1 alpha/beta fold hydrolase [Ideonella dechloratans]UFU12433.1 alpha/beta fold hydrolase [Ideonella dechloratans]
MAERTPLLLLPGLLCDAGLWVHQSEALADVAEVQVADLTQDDRVEAMAARVLAQAPARFALAGLSMGGYVAFEILRQAPERVSRLALLDTTAAPDSPERALQRRRSLAILKRGRFLGVTQQLLPTLVHPRHVHGPVGQAVQAMAQRVGPEAYRRQQTAILHRPDSRPLLPTLTQPTLVLGGADDALTPPAVLQALAAPIPQAQWHTLPDCGHLPTLEQPEATTALMRRWLMG